MSGIADACGAGDSGKPLVPGSLRGYRTWRPASRLENVPDGMLPMTSVTRRDVLWTPTMTAACTPDVGPTTRRPAPDGSHAAPSTGCKCGIYAWYAPDDTALMRARVFGAVEASGLVLMGDRGFRAERARVTAIVTRRPRLAAACTRAGIKVYRRRRDLLREHPPDDVTALLGERPDPPPVEPAPTPPRTHLLDGFDRALLFAIWARTALLLLATFVLPVFGTLLFLALSELGLFALIVSRVHT